MPSVKTSLHSVFLCLIVLFGGGCDDGSDNRGANASALAASACRLSASSEQNLCSRQCSRLSDTSAQSACANDCNDALSVNNRLCSTAELRYQPTCLESDCTADIERCLEHANSTFATCNARCGDGNDYCVNRCSEGQVNDQSACGYLAARTLAGSPNIPLFESGKAAELSSLLDDAEMAVVSAADERAPGHRQRTVQLSIGAPDTPITVTQIAHGFRFGVPLDSREFADDDGRLDFYGDIARRHTRLLVAETSLKWRNTEREEGELTFELADFELQWAESLDFETKAHVLLWGNPPPLASGSGTPEWLRDKFPGTDLSDSQKEELRALIKSRIDTVVGRYSGRIDVWEVTNEMLNPITSWFIDRLGPGVVNDAFAWAKQADPGAELVYNEWISDIFTGVGGPDAIAVRDRIFELLTAGVQVDAVGQQGHFAPGLVNIGIDEGLDQRTRVDDYAQALDVLAETGLPIHITEVTFAAPDDPELRAAQAEAIMRIWWGHPQVEEIIFWNFWNPLGPRSRLSLGVYDDDGNLSRHGEAILSLLNDRWRTQVSALTDQNGVVEFDGTFGEYVAQWDTDQGPAYIRFTVPKGEAAIQVIATQ